MEADISQVKKLRETTGFGVMACQRALEDSGGDFERATTLLSEREAVKVSEADSASGGAGLVSSYVHGDGRVGVLLEISSETDFVSRGQDFRDLARELALQICAMNPTDVESLLSEEWIRDPGRKIGDLIKDISARTKEAITVKRFARFELGN